MLKNMDVQWVNLLFLEFQQSSLWRFKEWFHSEVQTGFPVYSYGLATPNIKVNFDSLFRLNMHVLH